MLVGPTRPAWYLAAIRRLAAGNATITDRIALDPTLLMKRCGLTPDPWQARVLEYQYNQLILCSRQRGKSEVAANRALNTALIEHPCTVLYTSRTLRQVKEFMTRVHRLYSVIASPRKVPFRPEIKAFDEGSHLDVAWEWRNLPKKINDSVYEFILDNGSKIVGIPPREETVRGFDLVKEMLIDEASRVADDFYMQSGAYLATTGGRITAFTTPFGKRGWFWDAFEGPTSLTDMGDEWLRTTITAYGCEHNRTFQCEECLKASKVRISKDWLDKEHRRIGDRWFRQEYLCNPPYAPIWMGDFSFQNLGDVRVGDEVIGWSSERPASARKRRNEAAVFNRKHLTKSRVVGVRRRLADLVCVRLESGRELICTPDHQWLSCRGVKRSKPYRSSTGDVRQYSNGDFREPVCGTYAEMQFRADDRFRSATVGEYLARVIDPTKPLEDGLSWEANFRIPDRIIDIRPAGHGEVVSLQTETGNYVVWGYASKNCSFEDVAGAVFSRETIQAAINDNLRPLEMF